MLTILLLVNLCADADGFILKLPCSLESLELLLDCVTSFAYYGSRLHGPMTKLQTPMTYCHFGLIFGLLQRWYRVSMEMLMGCTAYGHVVKWWYLRVARDVSKENNFNWKSFTEGFHVCDIVIYQYPYVHMAQMMHVNS